MNKFNEFEQIKTPADWIDLVIDNNYKVTKRRQNIKIKYCLAIIIIILTVSISSLTITYAVSKSFRTWISERFNNNVEITDFKDLSDNISGNTIALEKSKGNWYVENQFIGIVNDDNEFMEAYVVENEKLVGCPINEYHGNIEGQDYSFKYVKYENRILGFDYQGCVIEILPNIIDNMIYVCVDKSYKYDLGKIDLVSGEFEYITNDHISVNPIASPEQTNILINKSDQAWVNYNTMTGTASNVIHIDPYAHSNCITFIDENTVITYDENNNGILLNILTNEITVLDKFPLEGTLVNIDSTGDMIKFTNVITGVMCEMKFIDIAGTYCNLDYIVLFDNDNLHLYDINHNKVVDLNSDNKMDEKLTGVSFIDKEHLLVSTNKRVYILVNRYVNS